MTMIEMPAPPPIKIDERFVTSARFHDANFDSDMSAGEYVGCMYWPDGVYVSNGACALNWFDGEPYCAG